MGHAHCLNEMMAGVDEEFEGKGEAVLHQAGGDEDALRVAELEVAVADGSVARDRRSSGARQCLAVSPMVRGTK